MSFKLCLLVIILLIYYLKLTNRKRNWEKNCISVPFNKNVRQEQSLRPLGRDDYYFWSSYILTATITESAIAISYHAINFLFHIDLNKKYVYHSLRVSFTSSVLCCSHQIRLQPVLWESYCMECKISRQNDRERDGDEEVGITYIHTYISI